MTTLRGYDTKEAGMTQKHIEKEKTPPNRINNNDMDNVIYRGKNHRPTTPSLIQELYHNTAIPGIVKQLLSLFIGI